MTQTFVARAPGKLFLLGEYAVLDGAPAVVAAVDRHVEVRVEVDPMRRPTVVTAPGHCLIAEDDGGRRAAGGPAELRFALAALEAARRDLPDLADVGLDIEIRSDLDCGPLPGVKLGLGGSAAVCAAVSAALHAATGGDAGARLPAVLATALSAHRLAQHGSGSGADVAASVYGGLIRFELRPEALPQVTVLAPPAGLHLLVAWSGAPAATPDLVRRYLALTGEDGALASDGRAASGRRDFVRQARACVDEFVAALGRGHVDTDAVNRNGEALAVLARRGDLPLLTPELERIAALARQAGAGAKLSGAGGGDCAVALTGEAQVAERVRGTWRDAGLHIVDLRLRHKGVSVAQT